MVVHPHLLHQLDALGCRCFWEIYTFTIPLIGGKERCGFVIRLETEKGDTKWSEVSPFPGRSLEGPEEVLEQLLTYLMQGKTEDLFPSVQFGLESLFYNTQFPIQASTYAFLHGSIEAIAHQAKVAAQKGHSTVKIKVGHLSRIEAQDVIHSLKGRFRLRIDCNRAFSLQEANCLFSAFDPSLFDYIEEPTYELDALSQFTHPFALDESLVHYDRLLLNSYPHLYGFIIKPTVIGGRKGCLPLLTYAKERHLKVILSPAFETGLGLLQILKLGQELKLLDNRIGLDTHRFLQWDLLQDPPSFDFPQIYIPCAPKICSTHLKRIAHGTSFLPSF